MFMLDGNKFFESLLKTAIVGVMAFGVTYLRGIGQETTKLNINLLQLKYEIRSLGDNQNTVNRELMSKLNSHEFRLSVIERKRK